MRSLETALPDLHIASAVVRLFLSTIPKGRIQQARSRLPPRRHSHPTHRRSAGCLTSTSRALLSDSSCLRSPKVESIKPLGRKAQILRLRGNGQTLRMRQGRQGKRSGRGCDKAPSFHRSLPNPGSEPTPRRSRSQALRAYAVARVRCKHNPIGDLGAPRLDGQSRPNISASHPERPDPTQLRNSPAHQAILEADVRRRPSASASHPLRSSSRLSQHLRSGHLRVHPGRR